MAHVGRLIVAVSVSAVMFATCSLIPPPGPPAQFANRVELPACGQEIRSLSDGPNHEARTCLLSAFQERRPAEFASSRTSIEGDPIIYYYRVWPNPELAVEVFADSSRDRLRSSAWTYYQCDELVALAGDEVFETAGCQDQPLVLVR